MERLTTNNPTNNFETMLNFVYSKDGWAHIRYTGEIADVPLTQWAKAQCILRGCAAEDLPGDTPEEIDEALCGCMMDCPDCPIALAYCFACQASHLRDRLKLYEDILFSGDSTELLSLDDLRRAVTLRTRQAPAKLDRSLFEGCYECSAPVCASCNFDWVDDEDAPCCDCAGGSAYEPKEYCAKCGRPLKESSWAELERRLEGSDEKSNCD